MEAGQHSMREVVRASAYTGFVDLVRELGGDVKRIAAERHLATPKFERPDEFISSRELNLLVTACAESIGRLDLGLLWGEATDPSILGPLHIAMSNSDTARDAIELASAYLHVHSPVWEVSRTQLPERSEDLVGVRFRIIRPPPMEQMIERHMVMLHRALEVMCNGKYRPIEVWFQHARLSPVPTYKRVFGVVPQFDRPHCGIMVERTALAAYRPGRNRQLLDMAETYLRSQTPVNGASVVHDVANMIRVMIESEDCTGAQIARALGLHERTMQRRLNMADTSFEKIKDSILREMAIILLRDPDVQISRIAWKLHYTNGSAFTRACQRWFGLSPREVRQTLTRGKPLELMPT
jgi:AraC-like DNA-binding protein